MACLDHAHALGSPALLKYLDVAVKEPNRLVVIAAQQRFQKALDDLQGCVRWDAGAVLLESPEPILRYGHWSLPRTEWVHFQVPQLRRDYVIDLKKLRLLADRIRRRKDVRALFCERALRFRWKDGNAGLDFWGLPMAGFNPRRVVEVVLEGVPAREGVAA